MNESSNGAATTITTTEPKNFVLVARHIAGLGLIALVVVIRNVEIVKEWNKWYENSFGGETRKRTGSLLKPPRSDHEKSEDAASGVQGRFDNDDLLLLRQEKNLQLADVHSRFPQCFLDLNNRDGFATNFLGRVSTKYVRTNRTPPYDHVSCFIMKARYNCAYPADDKDNSQQEARAHNYKFLFRDKTLHTRSSWCDLDDLVDWIGGPVGLGRILQRETNKKEDEPYRVYIQGDSRLRQVFESLVCRFTDQITDLVLSKGGMAVDKVAAPVFVQFSSSTGTEKSQFNNSYNLKGLEKIRELGCHGGKSKDMPPFYRPNTTIPASWDDCTDSLASVEFGHSIRFFYAFRPHKYNDAAIQAGYRQIGLTSSSGEQGKNETVDVVVVNHEEMKSVRFLNEKSRRLSWDDLVQAMYDIQSKHLGQYFGADNPWIWNPPDIVHPCMPGIPDDEANLLLLGLLGGV